MNIIISKNQKGLDAKLTNAIEELKQSNPSIILPIKLKTREIRIGEECIVNKDFSRFLGDKMQMPDIDFGQTGDRVVSYVKEIDETSKSTEKKVHNLGIACEPKIIFPIN